MAKENKTQVIFILFLGLCLSMASTLYILCGYQLQYYINNAGTVFFYPMIYLCLSVLFIYLCIPQTNKAIFLVTAGISACVLYSVFAVGVFDYTIDDAFISLRYAKNLGDYGQLVWNKGDIIRTEGYTALLWVLMCSLFYKLIRTDLFYLAKYLSFFWGVMALIMSLFVGTKLFRDKRFCILSPLCFWL